MKKELEQGGYKTVNKTNDTSVKYAANATLGTTLGSDDGRSDLAKEEELKEEHEM